MLMNFCANFEVDIVYVFISCMIQTVLSSFHYTVNDQNCL